MGKRAYLVGAGLLWAGAVVGMSGGTGTADAKPGDAHMLVSANADGQLGTLTPNGAIDLDNPFFQDLGTNGRRCVTCHEPADAWGLTPRTVQARFAATRGQDALFRNNDGSNCEGVLPSTVAETREAYSLLLERGLIRVGLDVPGGAEFVIDSIRDPYNCAPATNDVSVYRRPLPTANLRFLTAVMWDGRESAGDRAIDTDLLIQANSATVGHAAGRNLTPQEARAIVDLEMGLFTAQVRDHKGGALSARGAAGGPQGMRSETFFIGINDPVGLDPTGAPFNPNVFTLFNAWKDLAEEPANQIRRSIARGQEIFNTKPMVLSGVGGLNGQMFSNGVTVPETIVGTCTVCHDTPNAGNHSVKAPLDIGLTDPAVAPYLPVYVLRNLTTGEIKETTDPGRALISGKWSDVSRFKGPILRGLAARPPYFHNGSAMTLGEVVDFYERRFNMGLTPQERADLIAFLKAL